MWHFPGLGPTKDVRVDGAQVHGIRPSLMLCAICRSSELSWKELGP